MKESSIKRAQAFSVDIKDLYYSLAQDDLFAVEKEGIETIGEVQFQNAVGTNVTNFLDLLQVYLRSTVVVHNEEYYVQKNGICIGSRIAPIMSDLLLAHYDSLFQEQLSTRGPVKVFRHVDDFLVILLALPNEPTALFDQVFEKFRSIYRGLTFTRELPENGKIRFLDLALHRQEGHTCWMYAPRSKKHLLPYTSNHSKVVKRSIALGALRNAVVSSCPLLMSSSFSNQVQRLKASGYPAQLLSSLTEALLQEVRSPREQRAVVEDLTKTVAIPYIHGVSHRIKKAAGRAGVKVVF